MKCQICELRHVAITLTILEVLEATLGAKYEKTADGSIEAYSGRAQPPDHGVTEQVNLAMISDPEILQTPMRDYFHAKREKTHDSSSQTGP